MSIVRNPLLLSAAFALLVLTAATGRPDGDPVTPHSTGLVRWHTDFAAALDASKTSGKPVLLFDLLERTNNCL